MNFQWDQNISESNRVKHGIDFDQAKEVFRDKNALVGKGRTVYDEDRQLAIGKTLELFIIAVVFIIRKGTVRIISARQARKNEIKMYLSHSLIQ